MADRKAMRGLVIVLLLNGLCRVTNATVFQVGSPWAWVCQPPQNGARQLCQKIEKALAGNVNVTSLAECKLTCEETANIWPKPTGATSFSRKTIAILASRVTFTKLSAPTTQTRDLLSEASEIFTALVQDMLPKDSSPVQPTAGRGGHRAAEHGVDIEVAVTSDQTTMDLDTDETYELVVATDAATSTTSAYVTAATFFGARHGLETLSQLMTWDEELQSLVMMSDARVVDGPVFTHRGLSVDTARTYVPVAKLKHIIDAMSYNKLNVLHWHLFDSNSWPLVSTRQPLLAIFGAHTASQVYTADEVRDLVRYAIVRGVKVLPELDTPAHIGHGWEWGPRYGLGDLVLCLDKLPWEDYCYQPPCGLINPANDRVYPILADLYRDLADLFPTDMMHMGGDEVIMKCWNETDEVVQKLEAYGRGREKEDFLYLWSQWLQRTVQDVDAAFGRQLPLVYWTNGFTESMEPESYMDPSRFIIQVWTKADDLSIKRAYEKGFRLLLSNYDAWYFDCGYGAWVGPGQNANNWCSPYNGWQTVYNNDPKKIVQDFGLSWNASQVLGGEGAMWMENTTPETIDGKLWPRGAAVAERLWTSPETSAYDAEWRMFHHQRRLLQRGVACDGVQPEFCYQNEGLCLLGP